MATEKRQRQKAKQQEHRQQRALALRRRQRRRTVRTIVGLIVLVFVLAFLFSLRGGGDGEDVAAPPAEPTQPTEPVEPQAGTAECPAEDHSSPNQIDFDGPPPDCLVEGATYEAVFDTSAGEIRVALDTERTPGTVNNFVFLARYGYYDGTELFRTDPSIDIIQGGSPRTNDPSDPGPGYTIRDEGQPFAYQPGDLVMARTAAPDSASAQFFFSAGPDTVLLNPQATYVVFGRTIEGLDVLEAILASHLEEPDNPLGGRPDPPVIVSSVRIIQS